jgi:hypothetical protein
MGSSKANAAMSQGGNVLFFANDIPRPPEWISFEEAVSRGKRRPPCD